MTVATEPRPSAPAAIGQLADRGAAVRARIAASAAAAGRSPAAITLVAVTKGFDAEVVRAARRHGLVDVGENRVQELRRKVAEVDAADASSPAANAARPAASGLRWHFVGRLQRNKVADVVGLASLVHSVDRPELAQAIASRALAAGRVQRVLVQVNVGADPAKGGCAPGDALALVTAARGLDGIVCQGLATVPPLDSDPRPAFAELRALRDHIRTRCPEAVHLSMGMSADFEIAIAEGATILRLGTALFGARPSQPESDPRSGV